MSPTKINTLKHYYVNGQRLATWDSEGLKFYHVDHLSSTSRVSNQFGAQVRVIRYDPWATPGQGGVGARRW